MISRRDSGVKAYNNRLDIGLVYRGKGKGQSGVDPDPGLDWMVCDGSPIKFRASHSKPEASKQASAVQDPRSLTSGEVPLTPTNRSEPWPIGRAACTTGR